MKQITPKAAIIVLFAFLSIPITSSLSLADRPIEFPSGNIIHAEVVDTPEARRRGLMFRDRLPTGGGMLFIFQEARPYRFWMKNCKFAIDIIWLNKKKEIIYISEDTPPCKSDPCPSYGPEKKKSLYVIEVAAGFAKRETLRLGSLVDF